MKAEKTKVEIMTTQQALTSDGPAIASALWGESNSVENSGDENSVEETQAYRAGAYSLLGALLRSSPEQAVLDYVASLSDVDTEIDELAVALSSLGLAADNCDVGAIDDEYHALFIGIGRGEVMPYGSWYQTGFLMEKPLGILRDDLVMLGFERSSGTSEPEDHIAALCEVMSLLINQKVESSSELDQSGQQLVIQQQFFEAHISSWAEQFFGDLSEASSAIFYRSVGRFGKALIDFEKRYLAMSV